MKKACFVVSVIFVMLLLFGACSKKEAASSSPREIDYASMNSGSERTAGWLKELAEIYEKEKGIKVNIDFAGRDVLTKMRSRFIMGNPPDIIEQDLSELTAGLLLQDIMVLPLDDFFYKTKGPDGQERFMDLFQEELIRAYAYKNVLYFVPYNWTTSGFHYDIGLFERLGIHQPPKTMEEFFAVCDVFLKNGIPPLTSDGSISFYNAYYFYWFSARIMGQGAFNAAAGDKTGRLWDDPGFLRVAQYVYELGNGGKNYFQKGYEGSVFPAAQGDWAQGHSGMILCGSWIPLETRNQVHSNFRFGFFPFPEIKGGKGSITDAEFQLFGVGIPKDAKNVDLAKDFINFMFRRDNMERYAVNLIPIRKDVPAVLLHEIKNYLNTSKSYHISYDRVMGDYPEWFANVFYPLDNALFFGEITPRDFISRVKADSIEYWRTR